MSLKVRFSENTFADLNEIWHYISFDNASAADRLLEAILHQFKLLAANPELGRKREELLPGLRSFPIASYIIFYRIFPQEIEIYRVLSGFQDITSIFRS